MHFERCSDDELLANLQTLVGSHREVTARMVAHLAEVERRRVHLLAGYSSMFDFCTKALRMSEGEAFRRIVAARLSMRFPVVVELLASGALHLSALALLRERLTTENHVELLQAVSGRSKRDVETLLAARFPRPDVPSRITRARVEPLSEARFRVEFTASAAFCAKLERCRELMSHANPSGELGVVLERAVEILLGELERRRLGRTKRAPRSSANAGETAARCAAAESSDTSSRHVPRAVRRAVHERDGARCTFVAPDGHRCDARAFLELDHMEPRALGGTNDAANLRVRCRAHNQLAAEETFGREHVEQRRHLRQRRRASRTRPEGDEKFAA
jgi:hypothetical protein